ncbi:hypothetical protein [Actinophytocola glycyrrhizae]|uniref:Ornithine cyclodeaminase n=1 Tax=Actinophytocola glycyrrhizae TaxID=2044873 RepID=A0ABV9RWC9_9PSEU
MATPLIQLSGRDMTGALGSVAAVDLVAEELRGTDRHDDGSRLVPGYDDPELVVLEDARGRPRCVFPAAGLRDCRTAALTVLAARELTVAAGPVTAVLVGSWSGRDPLLVLLVDQFPRVDRIALCPSSAARGVPADPALVAAADLSGVALSVVEDVRCAVRGAALVVVGGPDGAPLTADALDPGALVVDASGDAVAGAIAADQTYVDDARLAGDRVVDAELGQVLRGEHPGRSRDEQVLLVELLTAGAPTAALARSLHESAVARGCGVWLAG